MVVIPIYNLLMVPDANIYLKSDQYRHLARRYAEVNDRVVLLSCKKEEHRKDMTEDSFYPIGVTGFVKEDPHHRKGQPRYSRDESRSYN